MVPQQRPVLPLLSVVPPSRRALSVCPLDANEERRDGEGQHRLVMTEMDEIMSEDGWMDGCLFFSRSGENSWEKFQNPKRKYLLINA